MVTYPSERGQNALSSRSKSLRGEMPAKSVPGQGPGAPEKSTAGPGAIQEACRPLELEDGVVILGRGEEHDPVESVHDPLDPWIAEALRQLRRELTPRKRRQRARVCAHLEDADTCSGGRPIAFDPSRVAASRHNGRATQ